MEIYTSRNKEKAERSQHVIGWTLEHEDLDRPTMLEMSEREMVWMNDWS